MTCNVKNWLKYFFYWNPDDFLLHSGIFICRKDCAQKIFIIQNTILQFSNSISVYFASISYPASFFIICFQPCNCDLTAFQLFNQTKGILMDFPRITNIIVKLFASGSSRASALCPCRSMTKLNKLVHIQRNHLTCSKKCIWETRVCGCSWLCYLCLRAVGTVESV